MRSTPASRAASPKLTAAARSRAAKSPARRRPSSGSGSRRCGSRRAPRPGRRPLTASPARTSTPAGKSAGVGVAGERAHAAAAAEQLGEQVRADVAGRAGEEDGFGSRLGVIAPGTDVARDPGGSRERGRGARGPWKAGEAVKGLAIKDVAERTGLAAGTIRMWEQRYGFPEPERTPRATASTRRTTSRRCAACSRCRERGLSVPAALERARGSGRRHRPAVALRRRRRRRAGRSRRAAQADAARDLARDRGRDDGPRRRRRSCSAPSSASATTARVEHRYRAMARTADAVVVFADFEALTRGRAAPVEVPLAASDALGHEWAVVVDAPGFAACLLAWEPPGRRPRPCPTSSARFETYWTLDPRVVRRAAQVGAALARAPAPRSATRHRAAAGRPPARRWSAGAGAEALTTRMVGYLDAER